MVYEIARIVAVMMLVGVAAALATPPGRIPLALRGVAKLFNIRENAGKTPTWKKLVAFLLTILAVGLAII